MQYGSVLTNRCVSHVFSSLLSLLSFRVAFHSGKDNHKTGPVIVIISSRWTVHKWCWWMGTCLGLASAMTPNNLWSVKCWAVNLVLPANWKCHTQHRKINALQSSAALAACFPLCCFFKTSMLKAIIPQLNVFPITSEAKVKANFLLKLKTQSQEFTICRLQEEHGLSNCSNYSSDKKIDNIDRIIIIDNMIIIIGITVTAYYLFNSVCRKWLKWISLAMLPLLLNITLNVSQF